MALKLHILLHLHYVLGKGATGHEAISSHSSDFDAVKDVFEASEGAESDFEVTEAVRQQIRIKPAHHRHDGIASKMHILTTEVPYSSIYNTCTETLALVE